MTYDVYWWDHDKQTWHRTAARVRKWTLRRILRRLYNRSWDRCSILVEQREEFTVKREGP